jgi:uncharacterized metal-binding protein
LAISRAVALAVPVAVAVPAATARAEEVCCIGTVKAEAVAKRERATASFMVVVLCMCQKEIDMM